LQGSVVTHKYNLREVEDLGTVT